MATIIPMQTIRQSLAAIAKRAEEGEEFIVIRNSLPSFKIVPVETVKREYSTEMPVKTLRDITRRIDAVQKDETIQPEMVDKIIHELHGIRGA
jgi:antitoxin (DNA-binding transcriptional repressor) of toxin-antitoxin stability system